MINAYAISYFQCPSSYLINLWFSDTMLNELQNIVFPGSTFWFQEEICAILLLTRACAGYRLKWQAWQLLTCLSSSHLHIFCQCNAWLQVLSNWRQRLLQASRQNIYKIGRNHKSGMSCFEVAGLSSHSMIWTFLVHNLFGLFLQVI